jgi:hypothetical protein
MTKVKSDLETVLEILEDMKASYADVGGYESRDYYERMAAKEDAIDDAISSIKYRFGLIK